MKVRFAHSAICRLKKHTWPGNIRELKNTVARAAALYPKEYIQEEHIENILDQSLLGQENSPTSPHPVHALPMLKEMERQLIIKKLSDNKGNQRQTALDLGIPKSTLHDRLRNYHIDPRSLRRTQNLENRH
jgi:DNA-binding NtrC family response regulator